MAWTQGQNVGGYEVIGPLGSGGMAEVYRVRHAVLGSDHALKILNAELVAQAGVRARFLDEGRVQAQLRHPGIVRVTGIVSEPGVAGLVMDLLEGCSLEDELEATGPIPLGRAVGWVLQALDAVGFAHGRGVVHRDLKPSNLFLVDGEPRSVRVLDFGIAKVAGRGRTRSGGTLGTYGFMAPEQLTDAADVDARADLFALGAVLYELVSGEPAFQGSTDFELMQRVANGVFTAERLPDGLQPVLRRALAVDRDARFQSCEELARALRPFASSDAIALVDAWDRDEDQVPTTFAVDSPPHPPTLDAEVVPSAPAPALPVVSVPQHVTRSDPRERDDVLVRSAGAAQILTGVLNTFFLWMLSCWGVPKVVTASFALMGLPGFFQTLSGCTALVGLGLLVIGPLEILAGVRAQLKGAQARGIVQRTATLQIASLAFGGLPSFCVGLLTTIVLLRNPGQGEVAGEP